MQNLLSIPHKADADLSANQYYLLKRTATGVALAVANDRCLGVLVNKPKLGQDAAIQVAGVAKVRAGAAVAINDYVKADATGRAITSTGEAAGTLVEIIGIALDAASAAGDVIRVLLTRVIINRAIS
jgi:hypothetical protein